jgi:RNA polymerase sigma-70 factor (ECF subfamily)
LKTWVYRIAVNEARNYHRWFGRHRRLEVGLEPGIEDRRGPNHALPDRGPSPFEVALHQEREALVEEALGKMRSGYRAALVLREVEGLSYEEIADVLGISLGTVKSRILRGRQSLRRSLAERLNPQRPWSLDLETEQTAV